MIELDEAIWGHRTAYCAPENLIGALGEEVSRSIKAHRFLSVERDDAQNKPGYSRVQANIPVSSEIFGQFLNGRTGYRAQYFDSVEAGQEFNRLASDAIAVTILQNEQLFADGVDKALCERSLYGMYTKLWFPKDVTSPNYSDHLLLLSETIRVDRWVQCWRPKPRPRKGLLAPKPAETSVLLSGTFICPADWSNWDQKPGRSLEIFETGWT